MCQNLGGFKDNADDDWNIDLHNIPPVIKEAVASHPLIVISHCQHLAAHCSACCHQWFSSPSSYEGVFSIYYAAQSYSQWDGRMLPDQYPSQEAGLIYFLRICLHLWAQHHPQPLLLSASRDARFNKVCWVMSLTRKRPCIGKVNISTDKMHTLFVSFNFFLVSCQFWWEHGSRHRQLCAFADSLWS